MLTATGTGSAFIAGPAPTDSGVNMKRLRIVRGTICGGVPVAVGDIVEADERDARTLLALGRAVELAEDATPTDDAVQPEEPAARRRGRPRKSDA